MFNERKPQNTAGKNNDSKKLDAKIEGDVEKFMQNYLRENEASLREEFKSDGVENNEEIDEMIEEFKVRMKVELTDTFKKELTSIKELKKSTINQRIK